MTRKEQSRIRNWNKLRLSGITIDTRVITDEEKILIDNIKDNITKLLKNWDNNSKSLGFNVKRYSLFIKNDIHWELWKSNITMNEIKFLIHDINENELFKIKQTL